MATRFNMAMLAPPPARLSPAIMLADLARCTTESDYREWVSATEWDRRRLSESALLTVERKRREVEQAIRGKPRLSLIEDEPANSAERTASPLLADVLAAIEQHGVSPCAFGAGALNDPMLVTSLRLGRSPRPTTVTRIRAHIARLASQQEGR